MGDAVRTKLATPPREDVSAGGESDDVSVTTRHAVNTLATEAAYRTRTAGVINVLVTSTAETTIVVGAERIQSPFIWNKQRINIGSRLENSMGVFIFHWGRPPISLAARWRHNMAQHGRTLKFQSAIVSFVFIHCCRVII